MSDLIERTLKAGYDIQTQQRDRIRALEAFLVKVLPAGIEDVCDECGGDLAKCKAENPDCYIAEARRLLPASVPETGAKDD